MAWFTDADLQRLAGAKSYQRGIGYADAVGDIDELPDGVVATVHGTDTYQVRLLDRSGSLVGQCSCPFGEDGTFCKHCVAVGRALLADDVPVAAAATAKQPRQRRPARRRPDLRAHLASVEPGELIDLLLELAADDPALHRRLALWAATTGDVDIAELRRLVNGLRARGFLDYQGSVRYARKADDVVEALDKVAAAHPDQVGPLYRLAIQHVIKTSEQADDSSGSIGDAANRAVDGYATACRAAPPDPTELANWIIQTQLDGPGWPEIPIGDFAAALGDDGLSAYWKRLAELRATTTATDRFDHRRFTITHLREEYLRSVSGDVDALVALYAEDLSHGYQYVRIAEALRDVGRVDDAIAWLRRGLTDTDRRVAALLADLCTETGKHDEALERRWELFTAGPDVNAHRSLLDSAERADVLAETAERALAHLRERAARGGYHADPLVLLLLSTGDVDAAWSAADGYGCGAGTYFTAAERRAETHPADAIPAYTDQVENAIERKSQGSYAHAARLLVTLRGLHARAGSDFAGYLAALKETHRRKRTFLAEVARAGL